MKSPCVAHGCPGNLFEVSHKILGNLYEAWRVEKATTHVYIQPDLRHTPCEVINCSTSDGLLGQSIPESFIQHVHFGGILTWQEKDWKWESESCLNTRHSFPIPPGTQLLEFELVPLRHELKNACHAPVGLVKSPTQSCALIFRCGLPRRCRCCRPIIIVFKLFWFCTHLACFRCIYAQNLIIHSFLST